MARARLKKTPCWWRTARSAHKDRLSHDPVVIGNTCEITVCADGDSFGVDQKAALHGLIRNDEQSGFGDIHIARNDEAEFVGVCYSKHFKVLRIKLDAAHPIVADTDRAIRGFGAVFGSDMDFGSVHRLEVSNSTSAHARRAGQRVRNARYRSISEVWHASQW